MQTDPGEAFAQLLSHINASWTTAALHAACRLRVPEQLADGALDATALAAALACHAPSLRRLLRALASLGVCVQVGDDTYALTAMGRLLHPDSPRSLRAWALLCGGSHWSRWGELETSVHSGQSLRLRQTGTDGFAHLADDAEAAALFHRAMVDFTRAVAVDVLAAVELGNARRIVDVGGGAGELLAALLGAQPSARGVLFDQAHALSHADALLHDAGVAERCELIAGDFFDGVPAGGDLYLLKSVLHNWDDERCRRVLAHCCRVMSADARLWIIERIVPERIGDGPRDRAVARSDLNMLTALSGRERPESEFRSLVAAAGLRFGSVRATPGEFAVIEARRV